MAGKNYTDENERVQFKIDLLEVLAVEPVDFTTLNYVNDLVGVLSVETYTRTS